MNLVADARNRQEPTRSTLLSDSATVAGPSHVPTSIRPLGAPFLNEVVEAFAAQHAKHLGSKLDVLIGAEFGPLSRRSAPHNAP
jgi:hypothetical protein